MVKAPIPGTAKTRLCPPYTTHEAARFAEAFLCDTLRLARRTRPVEILLSYTPEEAADWFAEQFPDLLRLPQSKGDLGARMMAALQAAQENGFRPWVVLGTDTPDLPPERIDQAVEALRAGPDGYDVVLGPTHDGG